VSNKLQEKIVRL